MLICDPSDSEQAKQNLWQKKIEDKIKELPVGITFTYKTLLVNSEEYAATAKALEHLIKKGIIMRIPTSIFYKPKQTVFGEL